MPPYKDWVKLQIHHMFLIFGFPLWRIKLRAVCSKINEYSLPNLFETWIPLLVPIKVECVYKLVVVRVGTESSVSLLNRHDPQTFYRRDSVGARKEMNILPDLELVHLKLGILRRGVRRMTVFCSILKSVEFSLAYCLESC